MTEYDEFGRTILLDDGVVSLKLNERTDLIRVALTDRSILLTVGEWKAMIEAWHRFKEEISWISD